MTTMKKTLDLLYGDILWHDHTEVLELSSKYLDDYVDMYSDQTISGQKIFFDNLRISGAVALPFTRHNDLSGNVLDNISGGIIFKTGSNFSGYDPHYSGPFLHDFNYGNNGTVITEGDNVFLGVNAGNFSMGENATHSWEASYNIAIGTQSFYNNKRGYNNTAMGAWALHELQWGRDNVAIGSASLMNLLTDNHNTAIGGNVLRTLESGHGNIGIGTYSDYFLQDGSDNITIGYISMAYSTKHSNTVAIGSYTGMRSNTSGSILLGHTAGYYCNTDDRIIIDNQLRSNANEELNKSIIVGKMATLPEDQELRFNANINITETLKFTNNVTVSGVINDTTLADNSSWLIPTEYAVKTYVDNISGGLSNDIQSINSQVNINTDNITTLSAEISGIVNFLSYGLSGDRPSNPPSGFMYFDASYNYPIWWTGIKWVNASGADV